AALVKRIAEERTDAPPCVPRSRSSWVSLSMYLDLKCTLSISIRPMRAEPIQCIGQLLALTSARRWTVERLRFGQLPMLVRVVVGLSLLNAWGSFEEFVVDRNGLWKYMPDYKVGRFCVWDLRGPRRTLVPVGRGDVDNAPSIRILGPFGRPAWNSRPT